jgi:hypothetical protein
MPITHPNLHLTKLAGAIPAWFGEINPATVGWAAPTMSGIARPTFSSGLSGFKMR